VAFPIRVNGSGRFDGLSARAQLWVNPDIEDGLDLLAMLVPISYEEARERWQRLAGVPADQIRAEDPGQELFRCIHWDEHTRRCLNYENRPAMCRWFPYGQACEYGCDCDCDRAPRVWEGDYA
jgi:Fe-S-cluster containining protein